MRLLQDLRRRLFCQDHKLLLLKGHSIHQSLQINHEEVRIREVILFGDAKPIVYARSIIPPMTSTLGYPGLGTIGSKPLGDLLFQSDAFSKTSITFAKFHSNKGDVVWGRRANYSVNNYPFSVMEVFLNP